MPTLTLRLSPPQSAQRHRALAAALTAITAEVLGKRAEVTAVLIDELPASRWHVGGAPLQAPSARLEIDITAGTNTGEQKAQFVEQAFAELQRQLAPSGKLAEASYVAVRELPATDWGYGGRTQQQRRKDADPSSPSDPVELAAEAAGR